MPRAHALLLRYFTLCDVHDALYELSHQLLQTKDLSDPKTGVKMNGTMANAAVQR